MDSIDQAYFSMFQNNQEEQQKVLDITQLIINEINQHLQFLMSILNINQQKLFQFCLYQKIPINIICLDKIRFKFALNFGQEKFIFFCLPNQLLNKLSAKRNPILQFYGGSIACPNKSQIYSLFKSLPLKKKFIKSRIKYFKDLEKLEKQQAKPKQENIENTWLQYVGYFRQK